MKNQYSTSTAYPLRDHEPRFLALDAFTPHKNKGKKAADKPESEKQRIAREKEEKLQQQLRDTFKELNVTLSIIPGGCTGYLQVLDLLVNKLIKQYLEEYEDQWIEDPANFTAWESGKWSISDRRILMTHWVAQAFQRVHDEHQDTIIRCFQSVGLSLPVDGSQDHLLRVRDLPDLAYGDWQTPPQGTTANPIVVDDRDTIMVDDDEEELLYTGRELLKGIIVKEEREEDVTTDSGVSLLERFDPDTDSSFSEGEDSDEDVGDENM